LLLVIKGCSFLEGLSTNTQNLLQKGRPLYCVGLPVKWSGMRDRKLLVTSLCVQVS
jgi:hypothetical protein